MRKLNFKKLFVFLSIPVVSMFTIVPAQATSDFFSDSEIQFYIPGACDPTGGSSTDADSQSSNGGKIYVVGDSITDLAKDSYKNKFKSPWELTIDGLVSRHIRANSPNPGGIKKIQEDADSIKDAGTIVIALGTNDDSNSASSIQNDVSDAVKEIRKINTSAPLFWVNVYDKTLSESKLDSTNKAIADGLGDQGKIIDWYSEAKSKADVGSFGEGVHPTKQKDIDLLVDLVYNSVSSSSKGGSVSGTAKGVEYDNSQSVETNFEVSVESDGADGAASGDGNYQGGTSYGHNLGWKTHFIALYPGWAKKNNLKLGDVVKIAWKGKVVYAIYGDNAWVDDSNKNVHTEVSLSVKRAFLGESASVATGFGSKSDVVKFTAYPNTNKKIRGNPPSNSLIDQVGMAASGGTASADDSSDTGNCVCSDPNSGATTTLQGDDVAGMAFNFFVSKGLKPYQAAGILGNMYAESSWNPKKSEGIYDRDVTAEEFLSGVGGPGWGIVQWTPGSKFINPAKAAGKDPNKLEVQLDFLWEQLEGKGTIPEKQAGDDLKGTKNVEEAVRAFQGDNKIGGSYIGYERPGSQSHSLATRIAKAKAVEKKYGNGSSSGSSSASSGGNCSGSPAGDSGECSVNKPVYGSVNGSGNQYTQTQLAKLFGNPGTADSHPEMDKNLTTVDFNGNKVSVNKKAAGCLKAVAADIKSRNISYKINQMGCYRYDSDNGSSNIGLKSYHTYGVACDINWDNNPFVSGGSSAPYDMPKSYVDAFHDHGWTWGGNWSSVKDYMHFEFNGIKP